MENDLKISEMMSMQRKLWEKNKDKWKPMTPEFGKISLLWMFEEIGEVIAKKKKKGDSKIMEDPEIRKAFVEELSDVYMYYNDVLLRFGVTPEEISKAYITKHDEDMNRDYQKKYDEMKFN